MTSVPADAERYPVEADCFDEAFEPDGTPRPHARAALGAVARGGPAALAEGVRRGLADAGVRFSSVDGDAAFWVDPVPRVITAGDWAHVKRGLAQRVRALNAFVGDAYGPRRIVAAGVLPGRVIDGAEYYEPAMAGIVPASAMWIGIAGLDVVRDHTGRWMVLEDNLRTPSGFAYLHAARAALTVRLEVSPGAAP